MVLTHIQQTRFSVAPELHSGIKHSGNYKEVGERRGISNEMSERQWLKSANGRQAKCTGNLDREERISGWAATFAAG